MKVCTEMMFDEYEKDTKKKSDSVRAQVQNMKYERQKKRDEDWKRKLQNEKTKKKEEKEKKRQETKLNKQRARQQKQDIKAQQRRSQNENETALEGDGLVPRPDINLELRITKIRRDGIAVIEPSWSAKSYPDRARVQTRSRALSGHEEFQRCCLIVES